MSIAMKRVKNKKIEANNEEKMLRFDAHQADPTGQHSAISSLESVITMEGGHAPPPVPPKSAALAMLLAKLSPGSIKDIFGSQKQGIPDEETHESAEEHRKKKYLQKGEMVRQPGDSRHLNKFHPVLVKAANNSNAYLPLHLFTLENLIHIQSISFSLPMVKVYLPNGNSVQILDVNHMIFSKEADMMEVQYCDAFPCYIEFMRKLSGNIWAERWDLHFSFFYNIVRLSLVFPAVLRTCIHLRKDYHAHLLASGNGFAFTEEYYTSSLKQSKSDICDEKE
ncbi:hypothetical protein ARMGADRAFT_1086637 [Armillaria gallica]|uniref:Uncharacterized protein n=1 Tax=Armillaria gallica TaxID=47427 RepID=A0A2H3DG92_ARMGA|nr:hypothetical protein ARMGADRAFT_1086637 [Armillaria gallica]